MSQRSYLVFGALLLGFSAASASPIVIAGSSYGLATSGGSACDVLCVLPSGIPDVTVLEQNYAFSARKGEVYDFDVTSLPMGVTSFSLTLTGSAPFLDDSTDNGRDFGAFVCNQLPKKTKTQCAPKLPSGITTTANSNKKNDVTSVTFTVNGDHEGLVFYAIESEKTASTVTADLTIHDPSIVVPDLAPKPLFLLAAPEPRLVSMLSVVLLLLSLGVYRRGTRLL